MKKILFIIFLAAPQISHAAIPLPNPVKAGSIPELIGYMIQGVLGVVGALALFYLVWGGIFWMTSGGNSDKVKKGKDAIVWSIFGLAIIFFSYALVNFVLGSIAPSS